jgi:hypothetical protein
MLGIGFALNVAYIGLPRFRYREKIRESAAENLALIDSPTEEIKKRDWYSGVARLNTMPDNGSGIYESASLPDANWSNCYKRWYEKHLDRKIVIWLAAANTVLLSLGSAHSFQYLTSVFGNDITWLFNGIWIHIWFWLCVISMIVPVNFVRIGNSMSEQACKWIIERIDDGKQTLQAAVSAATIPDDIPKDRAE